VLYSSPLKKVKPILSKRSERRIS